MINRVLLPLAKLLDGSELVGEECFVFERCAVDFEQLSKNISKAKGKKLAIPLVFFGTGKKDNPNSFPGSGKANASKQTYQKFNELYKGFAKGKSEKNPYPPAIFPHKQEKNFVYTADSLTKILRSIQELDSENLGKLFSDELQSFCVTDEQEIQKAVKQSVCLPVTPNAPSCMVHALLCLNAVNRRAVPVGENEDNELIPADVFRFIALFWFIDSLSDTSLAHEGNSFELSADVSIGGNISDAKRFLKAPMLVSLKKGEVFGSKTPAGNSIIRYIQNLTADENADTIKIAGQSFTAPRTGFSPNSSYRDPLKNENVLNNLVRNGADISETIKRLDNYSALLSGTRNYLAENLYYYYFLEGANQKLLERYIKAIRRHILEAKQLRDEYYSAIGKEDKKGKKAEALKRIQALREKLWTELFLAIPSETLLFAFEKNVGNANQPFYSWSRVYQGIDSRKLFLFLFTLDEPGIAGSLSKTLKLTGVNLSESWGAEEKEKLFDSFLSSRGLDWISQWQRWRRFFLRSNLSEEPFDSESWESSMHFIMKLNQILNFKTEKGGTGEEILYSFNKQMEEKMQTNEDVIAKYLEDIFASENETVKKDILAKSKDYSRFVDTNSDRSKWTAVVDGLICGWALKSICRALRPDDYKKVIGGRSLSKMAPFEINDKMVALREKVLRQGEDVWNTDAPMERILHYCQCNSNSDRVRLFTDAMALGFMRFDKKENSPTEGK